MSDDFYRAFEDRYRGARELIKSRLAVYLPFVEPLLGVETQAKAVDLGCGRGEWVELITELGFDALGIDLNQGMLDASHKLGLKVQKADALRFISALPDESQSIISAFHVVEHVTFEQLQTLVSQALRVLKPGGLLILETPNPENILVATKNFYLDPTHQRPIPPELLSFLTEYYGFARTKVLRLQESKDLRQCADLTLQDVLGGASPDYAVVAQKAAAEDVFCLLDAPFSVEYGVSLEYLTGCYQSQNSKRFQQAEAKAQQAEAKAQQAEAKAQQAEAKAQQAEAKAQQAEAKAQQAEKLSVQWQQQANQWHERLVAVHESTSWQMTRPLRAIKQLLSGDFAAFQRSTAAAKLKAKQTFRPLVSSSIKRVFNHPVLRDQLNRQLKSFPWLHQRLRRVALNEGLFSPQAFSRQGRISADKGRGSSFAMSNLNGAAATNVEQTRLLLEEPKQLEIQEILQRIRLELERGNG